MLDTPPKTRRSRFRSASFVLLTAALSLPAVPVVASAQTSNQPGNQQGWSSTVVTWTNASPPPGVILPGAMANGPAPSAPPVGATSVIPVVTTGSANPSANAPAAPLSVNGTVVRVTAAPAAPDSLAVASRLALGALKDRRGLGGSASSAATVGSVGSSLAGNGTLPLVLSSTAATSGPSSGLAPTAAASYVDSGQGWQSAIVSTDAIETAVAKATPANIGDPEAHYAAVRSQLAALVAARAKADPVALDQVWARTDDRRMTAVFAALAQVGTLYKYAGNAPGGFDCSGLTSYAWSVAGLKIPRISTDQINAAAPRFAPSELQPGDLVWRPGHIGMYLGVGELMVHSPRQGKPVLVERWGKVARMGAPL